MSETLKLPVPSVHLNGTGAKGLSDQLRAAYSALGTAAEAMQQALPHGRDYYPQDAGTPNGASFQAARKAHLVLLAQVEAARESYLELTIAIMDAGRL